MRGEGEEGGIGGGLLTRWESALPCTWDAGKPAAAHGELFLPRFGRPDAGSRNGGAMGTVWGRPGETPPTTAPRRDLKGFQPSHWSNRRVLSQHLPRWHKLGSHSWKAAPSEGFLRSLPKRPLEENPINAGSAPPTTNPTRRVTLEVTSSLQGSCTPSANMWSPRPLTGGSLEPLSCSPSLLPASRIPHTRGNRAPHRCSPFRSLCQAMQLL